MTDPKDPTAATTAPHVKPVSATAPPPPTVSPAHLDALKTSALTDATIAASGVYTARTTAAVADVLQRSWRRGGGLIIPFFDYDTGARTGGRVKPDQPRTTGKGDRVRVIKYDQPAAAGAMVYFPPGTRAEKRLDNAAKSVFFVEGEKKALLLDQLGLGCIGLTGSHNFHDSAAFKAGDGLSWCAVLATVAPRVIRGKRVRIVFDSDVWDNPQIMLAMRRLAGLCLDSGAIEVAAVRVPPDALGKAHGFGIDDYAARHGVEATRRVLRDLQPIAEGEAVEPIAPRDPLLALRSLAWLAGSGVTPDLRLPPRYQIRRDRSLWLDAPADKPDKPPSEVMVGAVVPIRLLDELDGEGQRVELAYWARGRWQAAIVDRRALKDSRRAIAELPAGVAVTSSNAGKLVDWITEYMRHNEHRLRAVRYVSQCGWQPGPEACFLLDEAITAPGHGRPALVADEAGDRADMLGALRPAGDAEAHLGALRAAFAADDVAAMAILGSLAAPLLRPFGAPNFAMNLHGDSSRGKSSMLAMAASVYGDPRSDQIVGSWNATATAMELRAATLSHLPLCFDEVGAGDAATLDRWIYMLVNGAGRTRGRQDMSLRRTLNWQTVVLSTGEHELVSESSNTGAQVRVLQFRVAGFGDLDSNGVDALREACESNHGHAGRQWIEHLVSVEDWAPYIKVYRDAKNGFKAGTTSTLMQRQAAYYGLLCATEFLAAQVLGIGHPKGSTVGRVFGGVGQQSGPKGAAERALDMVGEWVASEPGAFPSLELNSAGRKYAKVHASVRRVHGVRDEDRLYLLPGALRERLERSGMSYAEVTSAWRSEGHLDANKDHMTVRVSYDGKRPRALSLRCESVGLDPLDDAGDGEVEDFSD